MSDKKIIPVRTHRDAEGYWETSKDKAEYMLVPIEMWDKIMTGDYENDKKTIISQLVLAKESINEAMEKLTYLYPCKDAFIKKTVKYVVEILLGEASRITTFWVDELVDEEIGVKCLGICKGSIAKELYGFTHEHWLHIPQIRKIWDTLSDKDKKKFKSECIEGIYEILDEPCSDCPYPASRHCCEYDFRNNPTIEDKFHDKFIVTEEDLYEDCGDCVHARHPQTKDEWRFYYTIEGKKKVLDPYGVIQL